MRTLMPLNELPKNYAGGVQFRMMNGLTHVICWVTREALDRAEHEKSAQLNQIPCFERHRIQIEQLVYRPGCTIISFTCSSLKYLAKSVRTVSHCSIDCKV
jgi:Protein of unknown function (DUF1488)